MKMQNTLFLADPKWYLSQVALENIVAGAPGASGAQFDGTRTHARVYLDIRPVEAGANAVQSRSQAIYGTSADIRTDEDLIVGSYIPYISEGLVKTTPDKLGRIKLPRTPMPTERFVFTGAMNGCSYVLAKDKQGETWAVHYPNSGGAKSGFPLLEPVGLDVTKSMDFGDYGEGDDALKAIGVGTYSNAYCLLHHTAAGWAILCQPQTVTPQGFPPSLAPRINHAKGSVLER